MKSVGSQGGRVRGEDRDGMRAPASFAEFSFTSRVYSGDEERDREKEERVRRRDRDRGRRGRKGSSPL